MSTLTMWKFDTAGGAERVGYALRDATPQQRRLVADAVYVTWPMGARKPSTRPVTGLDTQAALGESFWGVLFGLIFYSPLLGAAVGSAGGPMWGGLTGFGIDETFVNRVRDAVTPGTSALFLLSSGTALDQIRDTLRFDPPTMVLNAKLTRRQESSLREVFVD
jgi:uncharacterized membrane protein